jgi:hypothetical protein
MAAIQEPPIQEPANPLIPLARRLGRSPIFRPLMQILGAIFVLTIFLGLAWFTRNHPDFAAQMLAVMFLALGVQLAWKLLPFSAKTRARLAQAHTRWQEEDQRLGDSWTRLFRGGLWFGPLMLFINVFDEFWKTGALRFPALKDWMGAGAWIAIGLVAHLRSRPSRRGRELDRPQ